MQAAIPLALQAGSSIVGGLAGRAEAQGQVQMAQANAYIARTRALQTNAAARRGLESEMASVRNVLGANGQPMNVGVMDMLRQVQEDRSREMRIEVGNRRAEEADWRMRGANASAAGQASVLSGFAKAGPSLFDLYQTVRR